MIVSTAEKNEQDAITDRTPGELYQSATDDEESREEAYGLPLYHRPAYVYAGSKGGKTKRLRKTAKNRRVK